MMWLNMSQRVTVDGVAVLCLSRMMFEFSNMSFEYIL